MSRYLDHFLKLNCAPDVLATVGNLGNKPEKEITEAMGVIKKLKQFVIKKPDTYQIVDLCSGNALVPVIAAHLFPIKKAYAIDKKPRERNWERTNNFEYLEKDIEQIPAILFEDPAILTAVRCCGSLAEKVIDIFNEIDAIKILIMMPCCIGSLNSGLLQFLKKEVSNDIAWVTKLAMKCEGKVSISKDNHVLSPKNYILTARKEK